MVFTIPGEPRGKQRPRVTRAGHAYTPKETTEYEEKVRDCYYMQGGRMISPLKLVKVSDSVSMTADRPLQVEIWAFLKPAESVPKKRRELMLGNMIQPTKKPDLDNIGKIILDGLNGAAYKDDKAVTDLIIHKRYDKIPRVVVEIREI